MDTCQHEFEFLRQETREVAYHVFEVLDVFFCKRCLEYRSKKVEGKRG